MQKTGEKVLFEGQWLTIKQLHYQSNTKEQILWESICRKNSQKILVVLAQLKPSNRYVLIKQFRPAIDNIVIGFPAGLAESDDIEKEALKELKEETGFSGKITAISPNLAFNPALTNETVQVVSVEIDESAPENINPVQHLEPDEEIEVVLVEEKNARSYLIAEQEKGIFVGIALWYLFGFKQ